ncbi:MAG: hypothetical protein WCE81_07340 [Halobacteriota archaeon]
MKKQFLIILMVTILLATVFVAGCTENTTNTSSPSPVASTATTTRKVTPTPTPVATSIPTASEFTDRWVRSNPNDTLVTPFTKSVNERGHVTFTGVYRYSGPFRDADYTSTFELCKDKADAQQTYQQAVNQASLAGYMIDSQDKNKNEGGILDTDIAVMTGHIPSNKALTNGIVIGCQYPDDYGIGYYVDTSKFLEPNT